MSFDYYIAIHKDDWPTASAVQAALFAVGAPIELKRRSDAPFLLADQSHTLPLLFEGREVLIEAAVERLVDISDTESEFGYIAAIVSQAFEIHDGDYGLVLTFRSDADEIRSGLYLAAALILKFGGYGFENQFESHGGAGFANGILAEAMDPGGWHEDEGSRPVLKRQWLTLPNWLKRMFAVGVSWGRKRAP